MEPRWITVFVDQPQERFDVGSQFWAGVTGSTISPRRGDDDEFATLVPATGDAFCRVQATTDASAGVHVDFHVDSIGDARGEATALGARVVADLGHVLMASPAGLPFCLVEAGSESRVPAPVGEPTSALDQLSIDVPASAFDAEVDFWSALLGWGRRTLAMPEFERLDETEGLPIRLLFQKLGTDSAPNRASAHLDIAAGDGREQVAAQHESFGAERVATFERWIVMRDPIGLAYCITGREPRGA